MTMQLFGCKPLDLFNFESKTIDDVILAAKTMPPT